MSYFDKINTIHNKTSHPFIVLLDKDNKESELTKKINYMFKVYPSYHPIITNEKNGDDVSDIFYVELNFNDFNEKEDDVCYLVDSCIYLTLLVTIGYRDDIFFPCEIDKIDNHTFYYKRLAQLSEASFKKLISQ